MYPEVQQYLDAWEAADAARTLVSDQYSAAYRAAHEAAVRAGWTKPDDACCSECAYDQTPLARALGEVHAHANTTCEAAQEDALDALKASEVPLVRWIAEHCGDYPYAARRVLEALPAPLEELDALATANNWCSVWTEFRRRALALGLVTEAPQVSEAFPVEADEAAAEMEVTA